MNWYYAEAGKQVGPLEEAQFRQLVLEGRIRADTLVWHEGMAQWQPCHEVWQPSQTTSAATPLAKEVLQPGQVACVECQRIFPQEETISYGTARVCAECKPRFLQKLAEGVPVSSGTGKRPLPVNADDLIHEVLSRGYKVDIGGCLERGWRTYKANFGVALGASVLVLLCNQASGFIPFLGIILSLIVQGPLFGGMNNFFLKLIRGEQASVSDAFSGFGKRFWPLCGTFLLMILLVYAFLVPAAAVLIPNLDNFEWNTTSGLIFIALAFLGFLGMIWLAVSYMFALPLAADLELGPWDALRTSFRVVTKHWFAVFALTFVAGLVSALGLVLCLVGVIFTFPLFYATTLHAYEDIFGVRSSS